MFKCVIRKHIPLLIGLLFFSTFSFAEGSMSITVVTSGAFTEVGKKVLAEAYNRIGKTVNYHQLPAERALISTNKGNTDGELFRIDGINKRYPNLIQIPVSYISDEVAVFSKLVFPVDGWQSLSGFSTAVRRGDKFVEDKTRNMKRHFVSQDVHMFKMLESDRVQVVIASRWDGLEYIRGIGSKTIKALSPSIVTNPMYHYVHHKHAELVPQLTIAIQAMHEDGTIETLLDEAENSIFQ